MFASYKVVPVGDYYPLGIKEQKGIRQPYRIDHVEVRDGKTFVMLADDPMLVSQSGGFVETTRPGRTFTGTAAFEITLGRAQ